jgi:virginiamycin B lyase
MSVRVLPVVTVMLCCFWGCSQIGGTTPNGAAQSSAAEYAWHGQTSHGKLAFVNTPSIDAWPLYITPGPQETLWFTEAFTDALGRMDTDGSMTEFSTANGQEPEGITEGADGNLWFTEPGANAIGRMTPQGDSTIFTINGSDPDPRGIALGPDGNVWYTEMGDGYIGRVTPQGTITRFPITGYLPEPWGITTGPDGDLWFTESAANTIGRFDPRSLKFKSSLSVPTQASTPWGILLAPDKHVWFTERTGDKIAEVDGSNNIREFAIKQPESYPEALTPGPDGDLWFTESQAQDIGRIDPRTGKFGRIIRLPKGDIPNGIAEGANKNVFFTIDNYHGPSQIGETLLH